MDKKNAAFKVTLLNQLCIDPKDATRNCKDSIYKMTIDFLDESKSTDIYYRTSDNDMGVQFHDVSASSEEPQISPDSETLTHKQIHFLISEWMHSYDIRHLDITPLKLAPDEDIPSSV